MSEVHGNRDLPPPQNPCTFRRNISPCADLKIADVQRRDNLRADQRIDLRVGKVAASALRIPKIKRCGSLLHHLPDGKERGIPQTRLNPVDTDFIMKMNTETSRSSSARPAPGRPCRRCVLLWASAARWWSGSRSTRTWRASWPATRRRSGSTGDFRKPSGLTVWVRLSGSGAGGFGSQLAIPALCDKWEMDGMINRKWTEKPAKIPTKIAGQGPVSISVQ